MGLIVHSRPPDVRGRGVLEEFLFDGVLIEPGDGAQAPLCVMLYKAQTSLAL
jgi:hypothetical protein